MACTDSPRQSGSGLDHLLKNAEFENVQQTKAIKTERETIQTYECQLEEKERQTAELEQSIVDLDEQAKKLHKQFTFSRDNYESLRRTSTVLSDHEEALKRKLHATQKEVKEECSQQDIALTKYGNIWSTYQAKYDSMERVQELKQEQNKIQLLAQKNAELDAQIGNLKETLKVLKLEKSERTTMTSWVIQIAQLHMERDQHLKTMRMECSLAKDLRVDLKRLQERVTDAQTQLKELQLAQQERLREQTKKTAPRSNDMELMDTHPNGPPANPAIANQPMHQQQEGFIENRATNSSTVQSGREPTRPLGQFIAQSSTPVVSQPQRIAASLSGSTIASPSLRYKLTIPTLSIPSRASVTKPSSSSIVATNESASSKVPLQIPTVQRYAPYTSGSVSSPLSVSTVALKNSTTGSRLPLKSTSVSRPQLTLHTPTRLSTSLSNTTSTPNPSRGGAHSLPKSVTPSLLHTPLAKSTRSGTHMGLALADGNQIEQSLRDTQELTKPSDTAQSTAATGINLSDCAALVNTTTLESPRNSNSPKDSSLNVVEGSSSRDQTEPVLGGGDVMETERTPIVETNVISSKQQKQQPESFGRSRRNETGINIHVSEIPTSAVRVQSHPADRPMDLNITTEPGSNGSIGSHNGAQTQQQHKEMEQEMSNNTLPLQNTPHNHTNTSNSTMVDNAQASLYAIEPTSSASIGDGGYDGQPQQQQQQYGGEASRESDGGNDLFQTQTAFTGDQMMFPVGDGMQFYAAAGNEASYGGDFFSFGGNDQAVSSGFSFGTPSSTPTQGDNTGFAFSFGGSATPESGSGSSFFSF